MSAASLPPIEHRMAQHEIENRDEFRLVNERLDVAKDVANAAKQVAEDAKRQAADTRVDVADRIAAVRAERGTVLYTGVFGIISAVALMVGGTAVWTNISQANTRIPGPLPCAFSHFPTQRPHPCPTDPTLRPRSRNQVTPAGSAGVADRWVFVRI